MNKKIQIVEKTDEDFAIALTKAPEDVIKFADAAGFCEFFVNRKNVQGRFRYNWERVMWLFRSMLYCWRMPKEACVLIQYLPTGYFFKGRLGYRFLQRLKQKRGVHYIVLMHDVEEARGRADVADLHLSEETRKMVEIADVLIVHNPSMIKWFVQRGVPEKKLVSLDIFDYDAGDFVPSEIFDFERCVTIAGNLNTKPTYGKDLKSGYLTQLGTIRDVDWRLYGPWFDPESIKGDNISYCGCFPSAEVPRQMTHGFGLVWDGISVDTCAGEHGKYLLINNPHKLSLYLASGLPVIIWNEAAEAEFVKSHEVGFAVASLHEIPSRLKAMTESEYAHYRRNAQIVSGKLRAGEFTRIALEKALSIIEENKG